jgi:hypothetical protein
MRATRENDVSEPTSLRAVVVIPGVKLKTPGNSGREHWAVIARRTREHRALARLFCSQLGTATRDQLRAAPRLRVRFVRIGGKKMDTSNVVAACKGLQDGLCDWLGVDDGSDWYDWQWPVQESGEVGVRIELSAVPDVPVA